MQLPGERANPDDPDGEPRHEDLQDMASGFEFFFSSDKAFSLHQVSCGTSRLVFVEAPDVFIKVTILDLIY